MLIVRLAPIELNVKLDKSIDSLQDVPARYLTNRKDLSRRLLYISDGCDALLAIRYMFKSRL